MTPDGKIIETEVVDKVRRLKGLIMNRGRSYTPDERRDLENYVSLVLDAIEDSPDYHMNHRLWK
jgi:hypothetical protein